MNIKRIGTFILSSALTATVIAGCSQQINESSASGLGTNPSAAASTQAGETYQASADSQEPQSFEELYATQLTTFLDHQYTFDGAPIPKTETNFYFINAFLDLSGYASMGYYPSTNLGYIDLAAEYSGDEYATYGDFFIEYAENSIETTYILYSRATAEGVTLSQETQDAINSMMESLKTDKAAESGMTLDEYLQFYYGPGNDEATFRKTLEKYYLADAYSKVYCENYPFTDEEKNVPYIRYALFYAPETAEQTAKDQALSAATAMKDSCSSIDDLTGLAQSAQEMGTVYDQGDIAVPKGQMVPKFEEWAYEEGRTIGELDVIYAPEYGYFVVGYLGLQPQSQDVLDQYALQMLSKELLDEVDAGTHNFHTDDVFLPAPAGPTATPAPDYAIPSEGVVFNPDSTVATEPAGNMNSTATKTDVLIIVFFTLAGVAIAAVIIILIVSAMKNSKNSPAPSAKPSKPKKTNDDDGSVSSGKSRKSKTEEEDTNEESEEDEEE